MFNNLSFVQKIAPIAIEAGKIILSKEGTVSACTKSNAHDLVTEYDKRVQEFIIGSLKAVFKNAKFVGEENGVGEDVNPYDGEVFIIDPIDGTANFVNSYGISVVSIAYLVDGTRIAGVVHNPYNNETFYAERGRGAYLNGKAIAPSKLPLDKGLVAVGTSTYYEELYDWTKRSIVATFDNCLDIRRLGVAALELCYVAAGRLCAFYEAMLCPHDYAAGSLIIDEAGAICTTCDGQKLPMHKKSNMLCANTVCYEKMLKILSNL